MIPPGEGLFVDIEYAFLADAAQTSPDGKLYVLGAGINQIKAVGFPAMHPQMSLVVKLNMHPSECDRAHSTDIELWDEDGSKIGGTMNRPFQVPRRKDFPARNVFFQMILNLIGTEFPRAGTYGFQISVDGRHIKSVPVELIQVEAPSTPEPPGSP